MRLLFLLLTLFIFVEANDEPDTSLIWGTYRPGLYFGLRPRFPESLLSGLMWFGVHDYQSFLKTRHACDQDDGLESYTWTHYDPREGGVQVLKDGKNNLQLTIEWLKIPGGEHGGSWAARVKGEPMNDDLPSRISMLWYLGMEGLGSVDLDNDEEEDGLEGPVRFSGSSPELGDFTVRIVDGPRNEYITRGNHLQDFANKLEKTHYLGLKVQSGSIWRAKEIILQKILESAQAIIPTYSDPQAGPPDPSVTLLLTDETYSGSNLYVVQKMLEGPFQFDVFFDSASARQKLDSSVITEGIPAFKESYTRRFAETFPLSGAFNSSYRSFSQDITANLLGGIGYFYGDSILDKAFVEEWDEDEESMNDGSRTGEPTRAPPRELLTATPSRSFFPRGFYWDEGFHLLHIGPWDNDLSLEILRDWIKLIDDNGWVGREQILGEEARSRVPPQFQAQYPTHANPPTLAMAVTAMIGRLREASHSLDNDLNVGSMQEPLAIPRSGKPGNRYIDSPQLAQDYLRSIYPQLKLHYEWFHRTQRGQIKQYARKAKSRTEAYRWRGRSATHVLTSGLDDYPRAPPHAGELHVDLISWMAFFSRTMKDIASFMGNEEDATRFASIEGDILANIDDLHWSETEKMYCDVGVDLNDESYHECHKGYISLFPFLLGLVSPTSPNLGHILDLVRSPTHLWSPYGIRSLSAEHPLFGKDENYWRGNIWIQMNYLALSSLYKIYAAEPGPYQEQARDIYAELRQNVIDNTFKEYERTGYVWEQYDALTGEGRRSHPFTGWTSLLSLIMSEKY
ncbi:glycoside hydrolase [Sistotremastrum niveocremeum HHB9708]|uniref:Mannosyl-oligosaccharide glucosidase n=2 Tax=Sistotremastraceae TaxID=3402574 RepID=A0A165AMX2_9AGAM|nr:glycoside hydrolase [Sistotremastrum niveocremeum HHB9708]KZT36971.1 glycoside hydrolase [Sistotremastrum suecicum HHB10207 ss-3]